MFCDKVTFVVFTFNEEARVERAVRNFNKYGRVLIVDCYSSDLTCELAKSLGAEILKHQNEGWVEDEKTSSLVKSTVVTPWIYWGFADEIVDRSTLVKIITTIESGEYAIINVARKNYYYGQFCHSAYRSVQNRVFLKDAISFRGNRIHQFGSPTVLDSSILHLDPNKYFVRHFISNTAKTYYGTIDKYSDIDAIDAPVPSNLRLMVKMLVALAFNYILRGGWRGGQAVFYYSLQMLIYHAMIAMKAYEREKKLVVSTIEVDNNRVRDQLLKQLEGIS